MEKMLKLKNMIKSSPLEFIMEAHNGLSAKIVEEAGFKGIWASGLTISASLGVRDNNEASWSQILEVLEFMSDSVKIPILFDGDTGYGNFNNARILVRKLEQRNIAGICIEDKLFPKTNSFLSSETQPLADAEEFCGKIKAMKDAQTSKDFVVVARVEAFIAGWGIQEALRRAELYRKAGADAILIHSKKPNCSEIEEFMNEWRGRHPVIIVPTKYFSTPTEKFRHMGVSMIIWANHVLRSSLKAMQDVTEKIFSDQSLINVEYEIAPLSEVFRLQGAQELKEAEERYLPGGVKNTNAVILAASQGNEFKELTEKIPKALLKINGKTIISTQIEYFNKVGIKDITVVRGYAKDKISLSNIKTIDNDDFSNTTELYSLFRAKNSIKENTIICYGDIIFKNYILNDLLENKNDIVIVADADYDIDDKYHEYIKTDHPYSKKNLWKEIKIEDIYNKSGKESADGDFIGLFKVSKKGAVLLKETLERMSVAPNFRKLRMKDLFLEILKITPISVLFIKGSWLDINNILDLQKAEDFKC